MKKKSDAWIIIETEPLAKGDSVTENPWTNPLVAQQQRELVDRQLQESPLPQHFRALAEAVRATGCPGSVMEIGCGSGYGREILDRLGVPYRSYSGVDISEEAIRIAKERYPESLWIDADGIHFAGNADDDVVIDGSCILHVQDWRAHINDLCAISRRWVILHRIPIIKDGNDPPRLSTRSKPTSGYGQTFPAWEFAEDDIVEAMKANGFQYVSDLSAGDAITATFAKPRHYVTYCDGNYLPKLKALHVSMLRHCGPFQLHVLAWDDKVRDWGLAAKNVGVTEASVWLSQHPELAPEALPGPPRTKIEHYWTCGPAFIRDVMGWTGQPVAYVDADLMFHSSPEPVFAEVGGEDIGMVPHGFATPSSGLPGPTTESHHQYGSLNVGLLLFNDVGMATDWAEMCRQWCYDKVERVNGRLEYGDQRYLERFMRTRVVEDEPRVIKYPGACPGPWGIHTRSLDVRDGVVYFGNKPLIAYHYSSYRELPDGHTVCTRPEYMLTARQEAIIYGVYHRALAEAKRG